VDTLLGVGEAVHYPAEAYKHAKLIGALNAGIRLLERAPLPGLRVADGEGVMADNGVVTATDGPSTTVDLDAFAAAFGDAIGAHRHHDREVELVPA
jgi:catalase